MAGLNVEFVLLLWLLVHSISAQPPQDPLRNLCRRYGHQTAVLDRKLYIDGGWVYANSIAENPLPTINQGLVYSDLDRTRNEMPAQYANLSKNSTVPNVAGGILWPDEINKVFWQYGGEFSTAPSMFQLWGYEVLLNQWNVSSTATRSTSSVRRVSYGAGTTLGGRGYYYGGYLNNLTNPLWTGDAVATSNLVVFDMDAVSLDNRTGPSDGVGRAEGTMVSIPASARGMLVYFGGVSFPYGNSTEAAMSMTEILLYDVADAKWYTQTATGQIPPNRRKFCAGATWAEDQSSYNIYIYGGFGFGENTTGFDDVWILTLPTFEWIKWYPDSETPGGSAPHGLLTCNVIASGQMIVMGGNFTNHSDCDVPDVGAQHNLNLGQVNVLNAKWYQYLPNITNYLVPPGIVSVTGGTPSGGANNSSPSNGWQDSALSVYFSQRAQFAERTPNRYIPSPPSSASKTNIGAIAGGVVGGVVVFVIAALVIWWFYFRKRKCAPANQRHLLHSPATTMNEMTGDSHHHNNDKNPTITNQPGYHTNPYSHSSSQPSSPYNGPPPIQPQPSPCALHSYQYPQQPHAPQQYNMNFPPYVQQQGYGFTQQYPHSPRSPPEVTYSQQQQQQQPQQQRYTPPPEIRRRHQQPLAPYEMPVSRTPGAGVHHVRGQPGSIGKGVSAQGSFPDQERPGFSSRSPGPHESC